MSDDCERRLRNGVQKASRVRPPGPQPTTDPYGWGPFAGPADQAPVDLVDEVPPEYLEFLEELAERAHALSAHTWPDGETGVGAECLGCSQPYEMWAA